MKSYLNKLGKKAKKALDITVKSKKKDQVLNDYCNLLLKYQSKIISENQKDLKKAGDKKLKENLIKRLSIDKIKLLQIINSIKMIIKLKDPVNITLNKWKRPSGLKIKKVTTSIGVIAVIYESRPNVTSDVASLCFKSGNPVILKGGSEAYHSNKFFISLFRKALTKNKVNKD